jgi:hypothetical protein
MKGTSIARFAGSASAVSKRSQTLPLEKAIRAALSKPGRTEGVRKIAARFGVDPSTVQKISVSRPFDGAGVAA